MPAWGQLLTFTNDSFGGVKMGHSPIGLILQPSFRDRVIFPQISRQLLPELKSGLSQNMERLNLYCVDFHAKLTPLFHPKLTPLIAV